MKNVLVVGGAGYIGSHTVQLLKKESDCSIFVVDDLSTGHLSAIPGVTFFEVNILDLEKLKAVFARVKFDAVFHFAAKLSVPESVEKPYDYFRNNVVGTANLLQMCALFGINNFIFSSSCAVYGEASKDLVEESDLCAPINPYGLSKKMSEDLIRQHAVLYPDFKYKILRYFNVSGAAPDASNGPRTLGTGQLILNLCQSALGDKKIKVFGQQFATVDGTCVRDYIHVCDLASAHLVAFRDDKKSALWNCGYGHGSSVLEVIRAFEKANSVKFEIEMAPPRKGDPARVIANNSLILANSDWKPAFDDLEAICRTTFNWVSQ
jgi:UDP-glucose 4-epimerase